MKRFLAGFLLLPLVLAGCGQSETAENGISLYYIDEDGDELVWEEYTIPDGTAQEEIQALTEDIQNKSLIPESCSTLFYNDLQIESWRLNGTTIRLDLSGDYGSLDSDQKLLVAAGLVKNYTQIEGIDHVALTIQGEPLMDSGGNEYGTLSAEDFVIHSGNEINTYSKTEMTLYFADVNGEMAPEERTVYYSSNVPLEQVVVDELIKGPYETGNRAVLPAELTYINISTQENIGYVNFDENISTQMQFYNMETALNAIVQSLHSVCGIEKVQFSVNGKTAVEVGGVSFQQIFEA